MAIHNDLGGRLGLTGFASASLRKLEAARMPPREGPPPASLSATRRILNGWKDFSRRMGNFQGRILLSFFFFIIITPFALLVKVFSDPLRIKHGDRKATDSYWLPKKDVNTNPEEYRRQF